MHPRKAFTNLTILMLDDRKVEVLLANVTSPSAVPRMPTPTASATIARAATLGALALSSMTTSDLCPRACPKRQLAEAEDVDGGDERENM